MADVRVQIPLGALGDRAQQQELTNFLVKHRRTTPVTGSNPVTRLLGLAWSPIIEVWERWVNPPVWETGERWFESSHLDCGNSRCRVAWSARHFRKVESA